MAITLDASTYGLADNSQTLTITHTINASATKLICQAAVWGSGRIVTGVTWNGTAMDKAVQVDDAGDSNNASVWYLDNPTTGTHDMVITATTSTAFPRGAAVSLFGAASGVDSTASISYSGKLNGITTNITTNSTACWVFDDILDQTAAMTAGGSQTDNLDPVDTTTRGSYKIDVSAGSNSMSWTWTGTESGAHALAAFAPSVTTTPNTPLRMRMGVGI